MYLSGFLHENDVAVPQVVAMTLVLTLFRSEGAAICNEATIIDFEDSLPLMNAEP